MLRSHNNLHLKWHTRSNMSVQRRNGQGTWILTLLCSKFYTWDQWRLSDREVERIGLENAANPEEADELEEMTADEIAVDGYYVVVGIARHEYKQGWKFLTLWDGYGLSNTTQGWYNTVCVMYCIVPIQYCNVMYCISTSSSKVLFAHRSYVSLLCSYSLLVYTLQLLAISMTCLS